MKKIEAIIQPTALDRVKDELFKAKVTKMTVYKVKGCGQQAGYTEHFKGNIYKVNLLDKIKIDIYVNDDFVQPTIDAIIRGAHTGNIGDGKITVLPIEEVIRIRTGEKGKEAIG